MKNKAKITVDPVSLVTTILFDSETSLIGDLRLLISGISTSFKFSSTSLELPWFDFKRVLPAFSKKITDFNLSVELDDLSTQLIKEYLSDRKSFLKHQPFIETDNDQVYKILHEGHFNRKLKDEQIRDAKNLIRLNHGANFSVPGAGKTTTILAVHFILKHFNKVNKLFVICPINAFISWNNEVGEIFGKDAPKIRRLSKTDVNSYHSIGTSGADIFLINYEKLRNDISGLIPYFIEHKIHLILDESHRIKGGFNNLAYPQIALLADLAKRRDIMTGTPLPQGITDLVAQFDIVWPGEDIIQNPENEIDPENAIIKANESIKNLYVRTTKKELHLKDPEILYTSIELGPIQKELYRLIRSEAARQLAGMDRDTLMSFRQIGRSVVRLLQASTNPMLLTSNNEYEDETLPIPDDSPIWELLSEFSKYEKPAKIEYLLKRVKEIIERNPKNKIVIWSYFVRNIILLEHLCKQFNPVIIYGGVLSGSDEDISTREGRIKKFHEDDTCRVMIANPQACGEGISLHKVCHFAIYLDRNFNAAHYLQSVDRIHRLGLDNKIDTVVEIIMGKDTLDEHLKGRLNDKVEVMGKVLDDKYLLKLAYDPADIDISNEDGIDQLDINVIKEHILGNG